MSVNPGNWDISIYQGATWVAQMTMKDDNDAVVDLSGYTARMMIRKTPSSTTALLTLTSNPGGGIVLGATSPNLTVTITAAQTEALNAVSHAAYDIEIISPAGEHDYILYGAVAVTRNVTR